MDWNYIIVGGGSAGCVLANRLSANPQCKVLLLEAGGKDSSWCFKVPAGVVKAAARYNWAYPGDPDPSRNSITDYWAAGKALGGGSSINGMMYVRGNPGDFDQWSELGCDGWNYQAVLPYFKRLESWEEGGSAYRGNHGPVQVVKERVEHSITSMFVGAAVEAGYSHNDDYNGRTQEGVATVQVNMKRGVRQSASTAYLGPVAQRSNLNIITGAMVQRVLFENQRAVGVEYQIDGEAHTVCCDREVVLSAGAIASPKLLMQSGIGDLKALKAHGIAPLFNLPGVGQNLQEHPCISMTWRVNRHTLNTLMRRPLGALWEGFRYLATGGGALASAAGHAQIFFRTDDKLSRPNIQAIFVPMGYEADNQSEQMDWKLAAHSMVTVAVCLMNPKIRGTIELKSNDPTVSPSISHQLIGSPTDRQQLIEGCRRVREVMVQPAISAVLVEEMFPGSQVQSDADWQQVLCQATFMGYHPSGTCKMGRDSLAVVDPELRVHGVNGLRVADASIMPVVTTGNTNAPVMMIAEKAADLMLADFA